VNACEAIVKFDDLAEPLFTCTVNVTVPLPLPFEGLALIQPGRPATVHAQLPALVTDTCTVPPVAGGE